MQLDGYTPQELDLEVEESAGPYTKPGTRYHVPSGQLEGVMYQVQKQNERGYTIEVQ